MQDYKKYAILTYLVVLYLVLGNGEIIWSLIYIPEVDEKGKSYFWYLGF